MNRTTIFSKLCLLSMAFLLVGCSAANRMGGWLTGDDAASEVAYVPPTTAAPQETKVYQSESFKAKEPATASKPGPGWDLDGIEPEPESDSIFNQPVGDVGYVKASPPTVPNNPTYTSGQPTSAPVTPGVFRGGNPAPRIAAETFDGQVFDSAQHLGKVVLVDFWFRSCGPCIRAMPHVDKIRQTYSKDQLTVVAINNDKRKSTATAFLSRNPHDWPQIHDPSLGASLVDTYGVKLFPTFVVIDQVGNVQYQGSSVHTAAAKVAELIQVPSVTQDGARVGVVASGNRPG